MKERIGEELFIARAYPIIERRDRADFRYGDQEEVFLFNPIIGKPLIGKERIIGAVEAVCKQRLFNCYYYDNDFDGSGYHITDVFGKEVGGIEWRANFYEKADKVLDNDVIENYMNHTPEEMEERIGKVRAEFEELAKKDINIKL